MKNNSLYYIIAGETSGDQHGALLMKEMLKKNQNISFAGVGGKNMSTFSLQSLFLLEDLAVMGFWEVFKKFSFFKHVQDTIINDIKLKNPDKIILIDYPGLNLRLAKKIKSFSNVPIIYYIAPQVWAWKEKRVKILQDCIDQLIIIFPFEKDYFKLKNINAHFVGHPFFDEWTPKNKSALKSNLNLNKNFPVLTLYPGSRKDEIKKHLPLFIKSALLINKKIENLQIVIGCAPNISFDNNFHIPKNIYIETKNPRSALECADFAIIASGTATIEASIFNVPSVIVYKSSFFSWFLAKLFIKTRFIGMSNLIANKIVMPEYIQFNASAKNICFEILNLYLNKDHYQKIVNQLISVSKKLGEKGASCKAANVIMGETNY